MGDRMGVCRVTVAKDDPRLAVQVAGGRCGSFICERWEGGHTHKKSSGYWLVQSKLNTSY